MIKINLLKSFLASDPEFVIESDSQNQLKNDFAKRVLVLLLGPLALFGYEFYNLPQLNEQKSALNAQMAQLVEFNQKKEAMATEISKYEEDKKRLNRQTQFLDRISKERLYPVQLLTAIRNFIPENLWMTSLTTDGNIITLKGSSDTERSISEFESRLTSVPILKNVKLQDVTMTASDLKPDLKIRNFLITLEYIADVPAGDVK